MFTSTSYYASYNFTLSLREVSIPRSANISSYTFNFCSALEEIDFPETLECIGNWVFRGTSLKKADLSHTSLRNIIWEVFQSPVTEQATLIVPEGSEQAYRNAEVWKEFKNIATPTSLKSAIVDTKDSERIYDLRGVEQNREKGLVIKNGIKIINN
ncbi:leucine-rich repeat protein [Prevotella sp. P4-119]|uniref:leucine-rich repeat protein n=1 Tax=Prevotella sp. P4-119 TaxID=2024218 RepID=UPI001303125B|nr:leucine-rich repeat protein [Prevotella sp. P4-119]